MFTTSYAADSVDKSVEIRAFTTSTGAAKTDITNATSGLELRWWRGADGSVTTLNPVAQTSTGAHTDGGIVHKHAGVYRVDLPDAALASGADYVIVTAAGVSDTTFIAARVEITASDPREAVADPDTIHDAMLDGWIAWLQDNGFVRPTTSGNATLKNSSGVGQTVAITTDADALPIISTT